MRYLILCGLYLFAYPSYAVEIPEITIEKQKVTSWNSIELHILDAARDDLTNWCNYEYKIKCSGHNVQIWLSADKSTLFLEFSLRGVVSVSAIYAIKFKRKGRPIYGKFWVRARSPQEHPLIRNVAPNQNDT